MRDEVLRLVGARAAVDGVVAVAAQEGVVAEAARELVAAGAAEEQIVAGIARGDVVALAAVEVVVVVPARHRVVAAVAIEGVLAEAAGELVVAVAAEERVLAAEAGEDVVAVVAEKTVVAVRAGERVGVAAAAQVLDVLELVEIAVRTDGGDEPVGIHRPREIHRDPGAAGRGVAAILDGVDAVAAVEGVVAGKAAEAFVAAGSDEGIGEIGAVDRLDVNEGVDLAAGPGNRPRFRIGERDGNSTRPAVVAIGDDVDFVDAAFAAVDDVGAEARCERVGVDISVESVVELRRDDARERFQRVGLAAHVFRRHRAGEVVGVAVVEVDDDAGGAVGIVRVVDRVEIVGGVGPAAVDLVAALAADEDIFADRPGDRVRPAEEKREDVARRGGVAEPESLESLEISVDAADGSERGAGHLVLELHGRNVAGKAGRAVDEIALDDERPPFGKGVGEHGGRDLGQHGSGARKHRHRGKADSVGNGKTVRIEGGHGVLRMLRNASILHYRQPIDRASKRFALRGTRKIMPQRKSEGRKAMLRVVPSEAGESPRGQDVH